MKIRETITRLETSIPNALKEKISLLLEEQVPKQVEDAMRPLSVTLSVCKQEVLASQTMTRRNLNHRIRTADKSICDALQSQKKNYSDSVEAIQQKLGDMKLELERVPRRVSDIVVHKQNKGQHTESRLLSAISAFHEELRSVRESLHVDPIFRTKPQGLAGSDDSRDMKIALQALLKHLQIL
jgi:hypothetical protein